ncbi:CBS domain-containing protein [Anaeromyxobacter paludicola]|uniref:Inosine-5-monophosphate dehydrogenase n=1 Tax=Anaeromyxobacter paludicola TaxID=2918171 RepID=A0ABN6N3X7_9BACT|nr:CBS domain-containing protein [Anaeromyxobacter paludicola]BDG07892.1 inosine-5-monophosphate dehydrogenase [Anaeromyxobacter paludicola]
MPTIEKLVVRDVVALDEHTSCNEAARLMEQKHIGSVGVKRNGKLVGIVTERDLVYAIMAKDVTAERKLADIMRPEIPTVPPTATERDCAHLMRTHFTRHLLVKQGSEVVGVISMLDVVNLMLEDNRWLIEQLNTYIRGGRGG